MTPSTDFIWFYGAAMALGALDYLLWRSRRATISQRLWGVNQWTLAAAFMAGLLCGHFFTVPQ